MAQKTHARAKKYLSVRPHRSFRKTTGRHLGGQPLPQPHRHLFASFGFILREKVVWGLGLLYAVLAYAVVGGLSQVDFLELKEATVQVFAGDVSSLGTAAALFTAAVSGAISQPPTELQQLLGGILALIFWLAIVFTTRLRLAEQPVTVRSALYNCCAPLIPSFIVLFIMTLQLLPAALGIFGFSVAQSNNILQSGVEVMMFSIAAALLCLLSLYWVASSALALVVATLPGTYPWQALVAASRLVIGQRWLLLLHLFTLVLVILVLWAAVLIPSLLLDNWLKFNWLPLVPLVAQALTGFSLVLSSVYIYRLYRSLL